MPRIDMYDIYEGTNANDVSEIFSIVIVCGFLFLIVVVFCIAFFSSENKLNFLGNCFKDTLVIICGAICATLWGIFNYISILFKANPIITILILVLFLMMICSCINS